jgi:hypothetical protein
VDLSVRAAFAVERYLNETRQPGPLGKDVMNLESFFLVNLNATAASGFASRWRSPSLSVQGLSRGAQLMNFASPSVQREGSARTMTGKTNVPANTSRQNFIAPE